MVEVACGLCHQGVGVEQVNGLLRCLECKEAAEYWDNLTPDERRAEDEAIARYVEEAALYE